jgi:hypothetical protein
MLTGVRGTVPFSFMTALNQIVSPAGMAVALKLELMDETIPPPPACSIAIGAFAITFVATPGAASSDVPTEAVLGRPAIAAPNRRVELTGLACGPAREAADADVATMPQTAIQTAAFLKINPTRVFAGLNI